ncbi:TetR/AcrR family transcriptional regulator [Streptomyces thermodiastaticus]|uniref:TetR/AcrR family transcriptional regulator n=1 Tax=Streptomyces thermodiastaticus TaxID=44061 RepID=UPI0016737763|nr:TetR family transcriptional regulator [Streptomyces thermodiastaticus]MCE7550281.1 TetR family transcriptional regulator [Streptomyces thermodiastaticus]
MTAARSSLSPADRPALGLRERKKIQTREAIRSAAWTLIREQGYHATTIGQIADRAEVSPSTVCRYFPAKEDIVLPDTGGSAPAHQVRDRPAGEPFTDSLRRVLCTALGLGADDDPEAARMRTRLMAQVPAVRSRMLEIMAAVGRTLCGTIAERTGRRRDDLEVRVWAMSLVGGLMETALYWAEHDHGDDLTGLVDRALAALEQGLPPDIA